MENKALIKRDGAAVAVEKPTVAAFVEAVQAGVQSWETAGRILVALRLEDEDAFKRINKLHPFITMETIEVFYHIGLKAIYPLIVLMPRHVFKALREMKYEAQVECCTKPIDIVSRISGGGPVVLRKPIAQLSADECKKALWRKGNRSVEHQVKALESPVINIDGMLPKPVINPQRVPVVVGRYAVRRAAAGAGFAFEKTDARPYNVQRILLQTGQAVIELTEYRD